MQITNLISKAKELFTQKPDQADLKQQEAQINELQAIQRVMQSRDGEILISYLKNEILAILGRLISTREDKYISDLDSHLNLFNKLISSKNDLKLIEDYLNEEISKYDQS